MMSHQVEFLLFLEHLERAIAPTITTVHIILDNVRMLVRRDGVTAVWATHLVDEVAQIDELIVLHRGRILAHGTAGEIVTQSGAMNVAEAFTRLTVKADASEAV